MEKMPETLNTQNLRPLTVYRYHDGAISPNPWKVVIILHELGLPSEMTPLDHSDPNIRTKEPLVSIAPNGRMPALVDPNTGIKLWESGAIIEYLLDTYDKEYQLTYTSFPENYEQSCWKHFQMSGQGPYFGQLTWFLYLHSEPVPSAQARYASEVRRVLAVVDQHLVQTQRPFLVGEKICFADLMFVPWNWQIMKTMLGPDFQSEWRQKYPRCWEWNESMFQMDSVKAAEKLALDAWNASSPPMEIKSHSATLNV